ncbi:recombinase family protein [Streptomyces sp. NBC_01244]|uniref:recombinase family protein n=1 Tax=Streptomyces sp. NBC_01244 TaxID=2903797 RepID=UPI002E123F0C|nr:recombinase family protein [Streptomyces sp. NBC_01244]
MRDSTLLKKSKASGIKVDKAGKGALQVVIYLRVSTRAQITRSGLQQQEKDCRSWLDTYLRDTPYEIVGVFADDGVSGKLDQRDDKALIERLVRAGKVDLAIAQKLDRYGRTARIISNWVREMVDKGTRVVTSDGRIDSDDDLQFKVAMPTLAYLAELEHELIFSRTWSGREWKLQAGGWAGGPPPYGFELLNKGRSGSSIVLCEEEVRTLVMAAHCLIDLELNYSETCEHLNGKRRFTRSGRPWTVGNLTKRLGSEPVLELCVTYRKEGGKTAVGEDGSRKYGEPVKIPMPEVFDAARRAQLRSAMEELSVGSRRANSVYPLSTRIKGDCGEAYTGGGVRDGGMRLYRCRGNTGGCDDVYLHADEVESEVWERLAKFLGDGDVQERVLRTRLRLGAPGLEGKEELFRLFDVQVEVENHRFKKKPGVRCQVTQWHVATKQEVPADVTEEEWAGVRSVLEAVYPPASFTKTKIDLRLALNGMLHRLRTGITWKEIPAEFGPAQRIRERQLSWWQQGAWPLLVTWLNGQRAGTSVYVHPMIPPLRVTVRRAGTLRALSGSRPC